MFVCSTAPRFSSLPILCVQHRPQKVTVLFILTIISSIIEYAVQIVELRKKLAIDVLLLYLLEICFDDVQFSSSYALFGSR